MVKKTVLVFDNKVMKDAIRFYNRFIQFKTEYYENIIDDKKFEINLVDFFDNAYLESSDREEIKNKIFEIRPDMIDIVKELKKYHIKSTDFHGQNIGWCLTGKKKNCSIRYRGYK